MDLQKRRHDFQQWRHDVKQAIDVRNRVDVPRSDARRLADMATPFQHHVVAGKYLRFKDGKLYSKLYSPTEFLARLGDKPSRQAIRQQVRAAQADMARRVDKRYGPGTAERIGLTPDSEPLTSRDFADLDHRAAAAAALHEIGVCHDASIAERDKAIQSLERHMRDAVKDGTQPVGDLQALAKACAQKLHATDIKELSLASEALAAYGLAFPRPADEQAAIRQLKLEMRPLMNNPAHPLSATDAAARCALRYHLDLEAAEDMLRGLGLLTKSASRPAYEVQRVLADMRKPPLSQEDDRAQALREAVLRHALGAVPGITGVLVQTAAHELARSDDVATLDTQTLEWIKATHQEHHTITSELVRQTRLNALLKEPKPDPAQRRFWLKRELAAAIERTDDPRQVFTGKGYIGKTMAGQARHAPGMDKFLSTHLPGPVAGLIGTLPADLTRHDHAVLMRDTVQAFQALFKNPNLQDGLPRRFRRDLRLGIAAINASDKTPAQKKALKTAWRNDMMARHVLAPAIEQCARETGAAAHPTAGTAAVLVREAFLKLIDGPGDADRQRMNAADLAAWEQCVADWRRFMLRAGRR